MSEAGRSPGERRGAWWAVVPPVPVNQKERLLEQGEP